MECSPQEAMFNKNKNDRNIPQKATLPNLDTEELEQMTPAASFPPQSDMFLCAQSLARFIVELTEWFQNKMGESMVS